MIFNRDKLFPGNSVACGFKRLNDSELLPFVVPIQALYMSRQNLSQQDANFAILHLPYLGRHAPISTAFSLRVALRQ